MSYFSDVKNLCWFLDPESAKQVFRLHKAVGNAVTEGRHIVVGTGLSQLLLAALFALSPKDGPEPMNVVSTCPYYSKKVGLDVIGLGNFYGRHLILKAYIWTLIPALAITQAFKFSAPLLRLHSSDCSEEKIKHVLSSTYTHQD